MNSSLGTINPTKDFSIRAGGRPLSGKRRPPHMTAAADTTQNSPSPAAATTTTTSSTTQHPFYTSTSSIKDIDEDAPPVSYKPLLGKQIVLSVGEALTHPSAVDLRMRTNREALVSAHRARQSAEDNKKVLERQCSNLQQQQEDQRRQSAEQHINSITRPNSAVRLTRAGISSNNSSFRMDDASGSHTAATMTFSGPQHGTPNTSRPTSAVKRSVLGHPLSAPDLALKTMQLQSSEDGAGGHQTKGGGAYNVSRPQSAQQTYTQRQIYASTSSYHKRYYGSGGENSNRSSSPSSMRPTPRTGNNSLVASPRGVRIGGGKRNVGGSGDAASSPDYSRGFDARMGLVVAAQIGSKLENVESNRQLFSEQEMVSGRQPHSNTMNSKSNRRLSLSGTTGDGLYAAIDATSRGGMTTPALALLASSLRPSDDGTPWQNYVASIHSHRDSNVTNQTKDGSPMRTMVAEGGKFPHSQMTSMVVGRGIEIGGSNNNNPYSTTNNAATNSRPPSAAASRPGSAVKRGSTTNQTPPPPPQGMNNNNQHYLQEADEENCTAAAGDGTPSSSQPCPFDNPPPRRTTRPQTAGPIRKIINSIRMSGPDITPYRAPPPARTVEESRMRLQQALQEKEERTKSTNQQQRPHSAQVRPRVEQSVVDLSLDDFDHPTSGNLQRQTSLVGGRFVAQSQRTQFGNNSTISRPPSAGGARRVNSSSSLRSAGGNMFPHNAGNEIRVGAGFVVYPRGS